MCTSTATLVYGITLQALELCIAAAGYTRVKPALLAVDLVRSRKANGTLETSTPERRTTACALPVELWDLVKRHILQQSYLDEWIRLQNLFGDGWSDDDCCEDYYDDNELGTNSRLTFVGALRGDMAVDDFFQDGGVKSMVNDNEKAVIEMLESFGLCLASVDLISNRESALFDFEATWTIGIPLARDGDKTKAYPHVEAEIPHEADPSHTLYRISPSTFILPANADSRFRRLLSSFPALVPTSHSTGTICPPSSSSSSSSSPLEASQDKDAGDTGTARKELSKEQRREKAREKAREKKRAARVPGWMLMASGSTCE